MEDAPIYEIAILNNKIKEFEARISELENKKCGDCGEKFKGENSVVCYKCICGYLEGKKDK